MVDKLRSRVSPKLFNGEKLNSCYVDLLVKSCNLAPTSFGIQPIRLTTVESDEVKALLKLATYNQPQIESCSHVFVLSMFDIDNTEYITYYKNLMKETTGASDESLDKFENSLLVFLSRDNIDEYYAWAENQAYLTLGILIAACASLGIDCCPIEGFDKTKYGEILGINKLGHDAVIICAIGKVSPEDPRSMVPKVRIPDADYLIKKY